MNIKQYILLLIGFLFVVSCDKFEEFNTNPNEPTAVSPDVLLPNAIRDAVNTTVDASFLVANNAAQLSAKILRTEVDAYNWNAFPSYWEGWYESLTDIVSIEQIALEEGNDQLEGVAIVLRSWVFQNITNSYGDVPYFDATLGASDNFTPVYDDQQAIYTELLSQLARANTLLQGSGNIPGDILLDGDALKWQKFANSLRLRLLLSAGEKIGDVGNQFKAIVDNEPILESNTDNIALTYTGSFPNEFPLVPLKIGDFDAVAIAEAAVDVMEQYLDPRLNRLARPNTDDYTAGFVADNYLGAINGQGELCTKAGASRLGVQYYNYPGLTQADNLGLQMAEGIIMTYAELQFSLAEAVAKGWIDGDVESYYNEGIRAAMEYHEVDFIGFGYADFTDFYTTSGVAYSEVTDIWEQKWLTLFFHGMEPYFEVRRWYHESGDSFDGIPFLDPACGNTNSDQLPLKFLYPGEEQSLNAINYNAAISNIGGSNEQNARMWLVQ
jgi:hypothetical protein